MAKMDLTKFLEAVGGKPLPQWQRDMINALWAARVTKDLCEKLRKG